MKHKHVKSKRDQKEKHIHQEKMSQTGYQKENESSDARYKNFLSDFKKWLLLIFTLLLCLVFIHLSGLTQNTRQFINHDDLDFIKPLLSLDLAEYWQNWLPNRLNYGFPIRDITFYLDKILSESFGLRVFWISNFIYFFIGQTVFALIIRKNFSSNALLVIAGTLLLYVHPLNIEVIQWLTCRKYLTAALPIAIGTYLFEKWKHEDITIPRLCSIVVLWLSSLACYPTAVLWIFWVLAGFYLQHRNTKKYGIYCIMCLFLSVVYLKLVGDSTAEIESGLFHIFSIADRAFYFGYNALGRGTFNLIFPFFLSSYYNESSVLNLIGLGSLVFLCAAFYQYFRSIKHHQDSLRYFKLSLFWMAGGIAMLLPVANTILSFSDFMLADRHFFIAIPFFIMGGCYFLKSAIEKSNKSNQKTLGNLGMSILILWSIAATVIAYKRVPLWQDALILMEDCRKNERAAKCHSQVIRSKVFAGDCKSVSSQIDEASLIYRDIKYSSEFRIEIPFFHSNCIAMDTTLSPREKFEKIDKLANFYGETPEIVFALTLTLLEGGNLQNAMKMAANYYMGPLELGPISATEAIKSIYAGQIKKICEISQTKECFDSLKRFVTLHPKVNHRLGAIQWGSKITETMAKRGGLI